MHCIEKGPYILTELVTEVVPAVAKAIHMILNGIGDDIYSRVDAYSTTRKMWLAIERLQQRESIDKQDVKTKLFGEFEWSRFVTIIKQQQDLDTVSYHRLFDILKQHQNEVNEIRAEKIARNVQSDDDYNVFAIDIHHSEQLKSINDTYVVEAVDSNATPDSLDMCDNEGTTDQNAKEPKDECVLFAYLIANLKLNIDENKISQK
nr:hypothetical protein [Tanacetum cinerariifolium]